MSGLRQGRFLILSQRMQGVRHDRTPDATMTMLEPLGSHAALVERELMATKDFGRIEDDYAFFMAHSSESENDVKEYLRHLNGIEPSDLLISLFDFGCGTGAFSRQLLQAWGRPPDQLRLGLLEPVSHQRVIAARDLAEFSRQPVTTYSDLEAVPSASFDVVLANHVLYYVEDLDTTLRRLIDRVRSGGVMLTAIAGMNNTLIQFWLAGFELLGRPLPYYVSEDVETQLVSTGIRYRKSQAPYQLHFPDTVENRNRILRFLFGEFFEEIPTERRLEMFDPFVVKGDIQIATESDHYIIEVGIAQG